MKKIFLLLFLVSSAYAAYSPNTIITDPAGVNQMAVKPASTAPVATDQAAVVSISPNGNSVSVGSIALPTGASTSANQTNGNQQTQIVQGGNTATVTASSALKVDGSAVTQPISGTTTANQGTPNTVSNGWPVKVTDGTNTMPTADAAARAQFHKITDGTNTAAVKAASTAPAATDPALVVSMSPNAVNAKTYQNANATLSQSLVVGSGAAVTFTPPSGAVGAQIEAPTSNIQNVRCAFGTAATTTLGLRLEPGRDTGYIPSAATLTCIAETGTNQEVDVQWVQQ